MDDDHNLSDDGSADADLVAGSLQDDHDGDSHMDTNLDSPATDNRFTGAGPSTQPPSTPVTIPPGQSIFSNPPSLGLIRQRLFEIDDTIELSAQDFERYWPYIDNVWIRNRAASTTKDTNSVTEWYQCRLRKANDRTPYVPRPTPEGKVGRKKRARENISCEMTLRVTRIEGAMTSYRIVRSSAKEAKHSHDLDYVDGVKRNSGIMDTARKEGIKGYQPSSTFHRMWAEPERMLEAGGKFLKISDCRNVTMSWRNENPTLVLKVHDGFASRVSTGPKPRHAATPTTMTHAPVYQSATPSKAPVPTLILPQDTLQYPAHARAFLEPYLPPTNATSTTTPHVTLTYASSLDSRITLVPGIRTVLSGPEAKAMTHYLRYRHDAILIGVRTAIADNPALNCRLEGAGGYGGKGGANQPRPIILDPHARLVIHPDMKMLQMVKQGKAKAPWIIIASKTTPHPVAVRTLKAHLGEYVKLHYGYHPGEPAGFDWASIFGMLYNEGIKSVMVEGGGCVIGELLREPHARLIDSLIVTIAPTFLGKTGVMVSPDPRFDAQGQPMAARLKEVKWQPMGQDDVIMCGKFGSLDAAAGVVASGNANGLLDGIEDFSQQGGGAHGPVVEHPGASGSSHR
jgi:2,5-diamino-6-(ribosylamino)-4(3H)-pyrimidinone 5'-phosphate reductase